MSSDKVVPEKYVLSGVRSLGNDLGKGSYGKVYTIKYDGAIYAAKEIHSILIQHDPGKIKETFLRECNHCSKLSHPNIVSFKGIFYPIKNQLPAMVMELMDESLTSYVKTKPGSSFERKASILHDVAKGLGYLHCYNPPIIHRDLSPNNILLKYAGVDHVPPIAKIADLGVAKVVKADSEHTKSCLTKAPGTQDFMPPEALVDDPHYDISLDVFSYGGIMLHTINDEWPKPSNLIEYDPVEKLVRAFTEVQRRQGYLDKMTGEAEVLRPLVEACLDNNPTQRPSIKELAQKIEKFKESPCLLPALQSGCYDIGWTKCTSLPCHMYGASVASDGEKIFVMAGSSPENDVLFQVLCYDSKTDKWNQLPQPGHYWGILHMIDGKLTIIGGSESIDNQPVPTDKVLTYNHDTSSWSKIYPSMLNSRCKPGVITHSDYVVAVGGESNDAHIRSDIEILNWRNPTQWMMANVHMPDPMWAISMTVSDSNLYILGYSGVDWRYCTAYQVPVDPIISSASQPPSSPITCTEIPSVPYWHATVIPNLSPPTIVGGCNSSGDTCTSKIHTFDVSKTWKNIGSLATARCGVGIALVDTNKIIVIGGSTNPSSIDSALAYSSDVVEKGQVKHAPST